MITICCILLISIFGRRLQNFIITRISEDAIAIMVFLVLLFILMFLWGKREVLQLSRRMILLASGMLLLASLAVYFKLLYPIEAVHFLVFSWFGWISAVVLGPLYGAVAVLSIGVGDEVLQHFIPSRVGDIQDVLVNLLAGYTGLVLRLRW